MEPPTPVYSASLNLLLEIALLIGDVDAVAAAVRGVNQAVVGEVKGQVADELLGHGTAGMVGMGGGIGADLRELVAVGAPAALELELVQREDHDATAKGAVGNVDLVGVIVGADLLDISDDHGGGRRILLDEGLVLQGGLGGGFLADTAAAPAARDSRHGDEAGHRPGAALALHPSGLVIIILERLAIGAFPGREARP